MDLLGLRRVAAAPSVARHLSSVRREVRIMRLRFLPGGERDDPLPAGERVWRTLLTVTALVFAGLLWSWVEGR